MLRGMIRLLGCVALLCPWALGCGAAPSDVRSPDEVSSTNEATRPDTALATTEPAPTPTVVASPPQEPGPTPPVVVSPLPQPVPPPTVAGPPAAHGEMCASADHSVTRACAEGLYCCYPCGIEGCDSVCHTQQECDMDRMRP